MEKNKTGKYLKYAIGEIVLVVIGILIALQFNNWNENLKNQDQFKAVLQQIYTVIDQDAEQLTMVRYELDKQIAIIDTLMERPESINPKLLPHLLFYTDCVADDITSEVSYHLGFLNFNPLNLEQSNLNKGLITYIDKSNEQSSMQVNTNKKYVTSLLEKINLPVPTMYFAFSVMNNYEFIDINFFSDCEIEHAAKLLEDPIFQNALKSSRSRKAWLSGEIGGLLNFTKQNLTEIKTYYPDVKLLYTNIGLIGDATPNNSWSKNIPLKLTNDLESIWEADVVLKNGYVKFRVGEHWYFSWGGNKFPKGSAQHFGSNIPVIAGKYRVILNLSEKTYQFIEINN